MATSAVLFPAYIYPFEGAWDPLYKAIETHPHLEFTVVVNPFNGPGETPLPDANYLREIPRLNAFKNVRTVGYLRIDYTRRPIQDALDDVTHYGQWSHEDDAGSLGMSGVFVDEVPNAYTEEAKEYLDAVGAYIKSVDGIQGDRLLIHNPGSVPDTRYAEPGPDLTVLVEETCATFESELVQRMLNSSPYKRERRCLVLHSMPAHKIGEVVMHARERAGYIFITDLTTNYYESFGPSWKRFIDLMQRPVDAK